MNKSYVWKIAGINHPNLLQIDKNSKQILGGLFYNTFKIIHDKLNFSYRVVEPLPEFFGKQDENGNWFGTVGQVINQEADLAFTPLLMTYERALGLDYSSHVIFETGQFIIKMGGQESNWDSITKPFTPLLWLSIFFAVKIFGIALYGIMKFEKNVYRIKKLEPLSKVFWFLFGTLVFNGELVFVLVLT
ncbi:probable glutamate receptor [Centruroides sculpturatus]|uniref:probable glutamate receptor n=1 Tax=Centruroides sculpturatus TaxID=218467 RepID=UPI000C6DF071|nr:probable glutamate receptor [Centruroides sculpturatus]